MLFCLYTDFISFSSIVQEGKSLYTHSNPFLEPTSTEQLVYLFAQSWQHLAPTLVWTHAASDP